MTEYERNVQCKMKIEVLRDEFKVKRNECSWENIKRGYAYLLCQLWQFFWHPFGWKCSKTGCKPSSCHFSLHKCKDRDLKIHVTLPHFLQMELWWNRKLQLCVSVWETHGNVNQKIHKVTKNINRKSYLYSGKS